MEKNILLFINEKYTSFVFSDLIFRILGLFLYSFSLVFGIKVVEPMEMVLKYGYFSFFTDDTIAFSIYILSFCAIISFIICLLYSKRSKKNIIAIRCITCAYISVNLLISTCIIDIIYNYGTNNIFIVIKPMFYFVCAGIYLFNLLKYKIPNFNRPKNNNSMYVVLTSISLVIICKPLLSSSELSANIFVPAIEYILSICMLLYTIDLLMKTYYAGKYL